VTETAKIILTALATIFGGVLVYVAGQLLSKLFIEHIQEQRKVIGEIDVGLVLWAREWANLQDFPTGRTDQRVEAEKAFREYASPWWRPRMPSGDDSMGRPNVSALLLRMMFACLRGTWSASRTRCTPTRRLGSTTSGSIASASQAASVTAHGRATAGNGSTCWPRAGEKGVGTWRQVFAEPEGPRHHS
jgi:hypothetical protein